MALGSVTRQALEARAVTLANTIIDAFNELEKLRSRVLAEQAAGTLASSDFYPPPAGGGQNPDLTNLLAFCNQMDQVLSGMRGQVNLPRQDYTTALNLLIGIGG
jgi:hypothetical protein